jgi:hypothetical protein
MSHPKSMEQNKVDTLAVLNNNLVKMMDAFKAEITGVGAPYVTLCVIRTSAGLYYGGDACQRAVGILQAAQYSAPQAHRAAPTIRDGAGSVGEVVGLRKALAEDIARQLEIIKLVESIDGVVTTTKE